MRDHAYVLRIAGDGSWFAGLSGVPDLDGPRVNRHGDLSKARFFGTATSADAAAKKLAKRGIATKLYVLDPADCVLTEAQAKDERIGRARRQERVEERARERAEAA